LGPPGGEDHGQTDRLVTRAHAGQVPAARQQATGLITRIQTVAADPSVSDVPYCSPDCVPGVSDLSSPLTDTLDRLAGELDQAVQNGLVSNGSGVLDAEVHRQAPTATG
jgi:hypothetical protein